jgi:hypothetical protein
MRHMVTSSIVYLRSGGMAELVNASVILSIDSSSILGIDKIFYDSVWVRIEFKSEG